MDFRLVTLSLDNFKGVNDNYVINFGKRLTLLHGPNGYGKTTIFDAIELALTGVIRRIQDENNEHRGKLHDSTVLHNDKKRPVNVKLQVLTEDGSTLVITRTIPALNTRLSSSAAWDKVKTYVSNDFSLSTDDAEAIDQGELEARIFGARQGFLSKFYRLLSYVSQSESTFFLKLKQNQRYDALSPLMDLNDEVAELDSLRNYRKDIARLKRYVDLKVEEYTEQPTSPVETQQQAAQRYERLTQGDALPVYDQESPYDTLSATQAGEKRTAINSELEELKDFLKTFSPEEYQKNRLNRYVSQSYQTEEYLDYLIFNDLIETPEQMQKLRAMRSLKKRLDAEDVFEKYIYSLHLQPEQYLFYEKFKKEYRDKGAILRNDNDSLPTLIERLDFVASSDVFGDQVRGQARDYSSRHKTLSQNVSSSQKMLKELGDYRRQLIGHLKHGGDHDCPLCGADWKTPESLITAVDEKTKSLEELSNKETKAIVDFEALVNKEFMTQLLNNSEEFLRENREKRDFVRALDALGKLTSDDIYTYNLLEQIIPSVESYKISLNEMLVDLGERPKILRESVDELISKFNLAIPELIDSISAQDFEKVKQNNDRIGIQVTLETRSLEELSMLSVDEIESIHETLLEQARGFVEAHVVDTSKLIGQEIYTKFFKSDKRLFEYAKERIKQKEEYLQGEYTRSMLESYSSYKSKQSSLGKVFQNIDKLVNEYENSLKKYQYNLTRPLRIPFYIYSAKILQNTPSGLGIFIKVDQASNTVVLSTSQYTSHDALHQLSSGQLSVVSMAFLLAMNVVYERNSVKLLIIDDPVQDMDALNINAFSELLRREFAYDHQVVISTHDDRDMQYMKFTISKEIPEEDVEAYSVQELFYKS